MRIGLCHFPQRPKWEWVTEGFRSLGHEMRYVHCANDLLEVDHWAELLIFEQKTACLAYGDIVQYAPRKKSFWAQWWFDLIHFQSRLEDSPYIESLLPVMRAMDLVFVKERGLLDEFGRMSVNVTWMPQACPRDMPAAEHCERPDFDVAIWGHTGHRQRRKDIQAILGAGLSVVWAGLTCSSPPPEGAVAEGFITPLELPSFASRAAVVLSCDYRHDVDGYWSDRLELACGMGACVVRRESPGLPSYVQYSYRSENDLVDLVQSLRNNVEARQATGAACRAQIMKGHTYGHRCREIVEAAERCRSTAG